MDPHLSRIQHRKTCLLARRPGRWAHRALRLLGIALACAAAAGPAAGQTLRVLSGGASDGAAANPAGLWVDGEENVYIADSAHQQI